MPKLLLRNIDDYSKVRPLLTERMASKYDPMMKDPSNFPMMVVYLVSTPVDIVTLKELAGNSHVTAAKRYISMLVENSTHVKETPAKPRSLEHVHWMLTQIAGGKLSSPTKAQRWLGYCQAILTEDGRITTVMEERDATRNIFKGM